MIGIHVTSGGPVVLFDGIDRSMDWTGAACVGEDPELWFQEEHRGRVDWSAPRAICETCPIREACLAYAMREEAGNSWRHRGGMWGGTTPKQRAAMDTERRPRSTSALVHGTEMGARKHRKRHEKPCEACQLAEREATRARHAKRRAG